MGYSTVAKKVYGTKCELCGWGKATCDVHHIGYQEHQQLENDLRESRRKGEKMRYTELYSRAFDLGYGMFNEAKNELPKNDNPENLSVLCPNCHREVHHFDIGIKLLDSLPKRRKVSDAVIKLLGGL